MVGWQHNKKGIRPLDWTMVLAASICQNHFRAFLSGRAVVYETGTASLTLGYPDALTCFNPEGNSPSYQGYTYEELHQEASVSKPQ